MKVALVKMAVAVAGAALLAGCAGSRDHRGAVLEKEVYSAIQPGVDNKESVEKTLGRPTFTGQFSENDWYYLSRDTNTLAFRNPKVAEQTVLRVRFDPKGNVASVQTSGKELIASIRPNKDLTPTLGRKKSFFEEFFGGIGSVGSGGIVPQGDQ
ncbi:outer membrane protein assembly factor BamE [Sphingomonas sinipercae]|uniref:Outer membrane protein assembly factor BamE n=1 Tax=Sphingomonas sinipercae TaxID=2714944 RepID=A0A6G7ZKP0_9SPHN|nr:outer membrane protein assembly factor BamE [Sphingomonas sinipercae]QIL01503.1 outer membrane protein assembly factor BamE [Sphingomonas sinipercae]